MGKPGQARGKAGGQGGLRLTPRDRELLAWMGRQRFCEVRQLARQKWPRGEFGGQRASEGRRGLLSERAIEARLGALRAAGLVDSKRWWYERPAAWTVTKQGLSEAGLPLEPARIDTRSYDHDLEAAGLCICLEEAFGEDSVLTEREIRSHDSRVPDPEYSISVKGDGFARKKHFPDFAISGWAENGASLLIELERTVKGSSRLNGIINLYEDSKRSFAAVLYVVTDSQTERVVKKAAERTRHDRYWGPAIVVASWDGDGKELDLSPLEEHLKQKAAKEHAEQERREAYRREEERKKKAQELDRELALRRREAGAAEAPVDQKRGRWRRG